MRMKLLYLFLIFFFFSFSQTAVTILSTVPPTNCDIFSVLKVGSRGAEVKCLQEKVGAVIDGSFGPMTKVAVKAFQASHGLVADGIVGPLSRAVLKGIMTSGGIFPAGCTSNTGYSMMTGEKCDGSSNPSPLSSLLSLPTTSSTPVITSLSATTIQNGEGFTIYGKNFTKSNTVLMPPLEFPNKYTNLVSTDGTSLKIIISTPVSESLKNLNKDNPQIHQTIINQIKSAKSDGTDGWYLPATISVVNENGVSNALPIKVNVLNGV